MANFYDVAQAIQQPNIVGSFNQGVQTAQRNNIYNEQQQVFQKQQAQQQNLQNLAPQVIAGDPSAFAQAAAIDPDAAAKYQGAGDQQLTRLRGALNYLDQARKTGNPAAIDAAWQQAKPFLSQIAGKPAPDHWDPSFEPGLEQALAKVSQLPQQKSDLINVGAGGAVFDPSTGKPVYTNPGVQKPMQVVSIPDGHGGTIQGFADPTTGVVRPATYQGAQGAPSGNPAHQTMIMPATPQDASAPSSVTSASPVNAGAVDQANALLAQGLTPEAVMQQLVTARPDQQFSLSLDQRTGKFKDATPFPMQPAQTGGLGFTPAKPGAGDKFAQNKAFADQLKASGAITTPEEYDQVLLNGRVDSDFQGNSNVKPFGDETKTGAEYLQTLSGGNADIVKGLLNGTVQLPTGTALKNGFWQSALASVKHADPAWNQAAYQQFATTRKYMTTGQGGKLINSINTGAQHLQKLVDDINALDNSNVRPLAAASNFLSSNLGGQALTNFMGDVTPVASELASIYKNGGTPTDQETQHWREALSPNMSRGQQLNVVRGWIDLLAGKLNATHDQYRAAMSPLSDPLNVINPKASQALEKITQLANSISTTGQHETPAANQAPVYAPGQQAAPQATQDFSHLWSGQ